MNAQKKDFRVVTHFRADDDEFVATRIIELWGRDEFPGVSSHPLIVVDAGLRLTRSEIKSWMKGGHIPVGVGGKLNPFDEHGRGDGKSAATMAAMRFGITEDPALKPILAYSLRADDQAVDHPFNMATNIKTLHSSGVPLETIRQMHARWFDSYYLYFGNRFIFSDAPRKSLRQMAIEWLLDRFATAHRPATEYRSFADAMEAVDVSADDADELREIQRFVDRDYATVGGYNTFDLQGLVRVQQFTGARDEDIMRDVAVVLDSKIKSQRDFNEATKFYRQHAAYVDGDTRVGVIRSDNEQMQKAARRHNPRLNVLVQVRSTGYVQIFSDQKRDLRPILARLRAAEYAKSGRTGSLRRDELFSAGTLSKVSQWYGFEKYGQVIHIFNGSLKTRNTRKTKLTEREIVQCVREGLQHVHRARGVQRDRSVPVAPHSRSDIAKPVQPPSDVKA